MNNVNWSRFAIACIAVYAFYHLFGWVVHEQIMADQYAALSGTVFRPDEQINEKIWLMFLTSAVWSVLFCYIFVRGYEGKGLMEGVRYGVIMTFFFGLPFAYESWIFYPIPLSLAHAWFIAGAAFSILAGLIVAVVYRPRHTMGM